MPFICAELNSTAWGASGMCAKCVLVVDDEADVRAVVRGCLEDIAGWQVITAASGQEGLTIALSDRPDAILLDMMMPEMDGLTFLKNLRSNPVIHESYLPVILLTAKVSVAQTSELNDLGVLGIIAKPFEPFLLADQIANFLGWSGDVEPDC